MVFWLVYRFVCRLLAVGYSVDVFFVSGFVNLSLCVFVYSADLLVCVVGFYICLFMVVCLWVVTVVVRRYLRMVAFVQVCFVLYRLLLA